MVLAHRQRTTHGKRNHDPDNLSEDLLKLRDGLREQGWNLPELRPRDDFRRTEAPGHGFDRRRRWGIIQKPVSTMSKVRQELRTVIRNGAGRTAIQEIRRKHGLSSRWEKNAISALRL